MYVRLQTQEPTSQSSEVLERQELAGKSHPEVGQVRDKHFTEAVWTGQELHTTPVFSSSASLASLGVANPLSSPRASFHCKMETKY